ncbi:3-hydroxyacid dehydrogenase/reductase [Niveomyces insectorum RCEF 264]|uniref:3-hydroxyacid dehydrogenase/reductase n=1 Tax=Niveomyces insectorum RCEF 264 TaxID=1081102 RepID=A0A167MH19_9HYPO|nr:3-hydroxyacid dehydrogenase/reductase [Niveomyces insectorum RCEF 264]
MAASTSLPRVSVAGLGAMGIGFARNLLKAGFEVYGYDIVPALVDRFVQSGGKATATSSPKEAAEKSDILVIMVINTTQVNAVLFAENTGAIHGLAKNAAVIISSTIPGAFAREVRSRLNTEFQRPDIRLLDCPVSGGAAGAANGTLTVFACGSDDDIKFATPVLEAIGAHIYRIKNKAGGPGETGSGANGKIVHQVMTQIAIVLVAEIFALAVRAGVNTQELYDYLQSGLAASWIAENRIPHALEGDEAVYSAMTNSQKDSSIIVQTAAALSVPVPLVAQAEQVYNTTVHIGWAGMEDALLWRLFAREYPKDAVFQQTKVPRGTTNPGLSFADIADIMVGVHLAASAEITSFTDAVGLHAEQVHSFVCSAAGWNVQFEKLAPKMKNGPWYLRDIEEAKEIGIKLGKALRKANALGATLPIASTALQVFQLQVGPLTID